jgi:hypothetical protein
MAYATINKPNLYFNTVLYTGTGTTNSVTGVNFKPDFVWIKQRSTTRSHVLYDVVRGATKDLRTNDTTAEATDATTLSSFNSDGFTVVTDDKVNVSSGTYASWNWLGSNTTTNNTAGTISSTVCANTTSGFSIVTYTGTGANATVGHGLSVAPKMIIVKGRSTVYDWVVWQTSLAATDFIVLNKTDAKGTAAAVWNSTIPTSTVFSLGSNLAVNENGATQIAYCFADVKGYSKFGSYIGNGSTDGTFVYTGFKPAYVMIKQTNTSGNDWYVYDNKRETYNFMDNILRPNTTDADTITTVVSLDFLSNGIKMRGTNTGMNGSGATYIYACFAENPLVGTNNIPTTAR